MKVITVISDEENQGFFLLKLSCAINNLEMTSLVPNKKKFKSNRLKDSILMGYLEGLNNDELIFFTDGYDALFLAGENEILTKFKHFNKGIVFSTETNCWPDKNLANQYPKLNSSNYKYLNSGGFIGKVGLIKELLSDRCFTSDKFQKSNQYLWAKMFLENQNIIGLDTSCDIFCTFSPEIGAAYLPKEGNNDYYNYYVFMHEWFRDNFQIDKSRIFNKTSKTWPCHAHFNGDSKVLIDNDIKNIIISKIPRSSKIEILYEHSEALQ